MEKSLMACLKVILIKHLDRVNCLKSIRRLQWGVRQCHRVLGHLQKFYYMGSSFL